MTTYNKETMRRFITRVVPIIFGALVITALGIDAADTLSGSRSTLLGQIIATEENGCPDGMQAHPTANTFACFDIYEVSASIECPVQNPASEIDSLKNAQHNSCGAVSAESKRPWTFISRETAQLACMRAGKRLPTNEEWQLIAMGTPDGARDCNVRAGLLSNAGEFESCVSAVGAYDTVGNAWEWTDDDVFDGVYNGRVLPPEGYVLQVDKGGVATKSGTSSAELFGDDYFWSKQTGAYAMMRGGFYGSQKDAGVYTTHAATLPTMAGAAIGFRCVK